MKKMTTLGKVFDRVDELSRNCTDKLIKVKEISFDNLESVKINGHRHPLRTIAQRSIAYRLAIPFQYLRRCPREVQAYNMNYWMPKEKNEELFFRFDGSEVRAIFTSKYTPVDNFELMERLDAMGYEPETKVQCHLDPEFMALSILDEHKRFQVNGERMTPGISISNSEVGLASLSISAFVLRLVCTNGLVSRKEISASYRHVSTKILNEFPEVISKVSRELGIQRHQLMLSVDSKVDDQQSTFERFNKQFQLNQMEREAVEWAWPHEAGDTMFNVINAYTRAAQFEGLPAESSYKLQRVGGDILDMLG